MMTLDLKMGAMGATFVTVVTSAYLWGVGSGRAEMERTLDPTIRELTAENNKLKRELIELEAQQVGAAALEAAGRVLECGDVCAQEVDAALEGCTLLLCGEVRK